MNVIFNSIEGRVYNQMTIKPQRCREFIRLTKDQQSEEATNKRNLFRLLKEVLGWFIDLIKAIALLNRLFFGSSILY